MANTTKMLNVVITIMLAISESEEYKDRVVLLSGADSNKAVFTPRMNKEEHKTTSPPIQTPRSVFYAAKGMQSQKWQFPQHQIQGL